MIGAADSRRVARARPREADDRRIDSPRPPAADCDPGANPDDGPAGDHPGHRPGRHGVPAHLELRPSDRRPLGLRLDVLPRPPRPQQDLRRRPPPGHLPRRARLLLARGRAPSGGLLPQPRQASRRDARGEARLAAPPQHHPGGPRRRRLRELHRGSPRQAAAHRLPHDRLRRRHVAGRHARRADASPRRAALARRAADRRRAGRRPGPRCLALGHHHDHRPRPVGRPRVVGALLVPHVDPRDRRRRPLQGARGGARRPAGRHGRARSSGAW